MDWTSTGVLLVLALGANLPLGWWRSYQRRFSPAWFLGIHASIPLLIAMRFALGISYAIIPFEIAAVVAGQLAGSRLVGRFVFTAAPRFSPHDEPKAKKQR